MGLAISLGIWPLGLLTDDLRNYTSKHNKKKQLKKQRKSYNLGNEDTGFCGRNSAVECQLPKLDVVGSNPIARFFVLLASTNDSIHSQDYILSAYVS